MRAVQEQRRRNLYSLFAGISTFLSLGHFLVLYFSLKLAREFDDQQSKFDLSIPNWNTKMNLPFAIVMGVFAAIQFCASFSIVISNRKTGAARVLYYNALLALLTAFAIGVNLTILASQYNSALRQVPKDQTIFPTILPYYFTLQVDAVATFLFSVPMLLFIFYYNLEEYLREQRQANKETILPAEAFNKQIWLLALFLLNALAHIAFIYNIYQFTGIEDAKDYNLDSLADQYTFYFAVEVAITLVALFIQIKHFRKSFLNKNQLILVATLAALFQFGSFIVMAIKSVQFHLDISLMQDGVCYFIDCDESATFRWEITGYTIFTWLALLGQIPYFQSISTVAEQAENRDTLLTEQSTES